MGDAAGRFQLLKTQHLHICHWANLVSPFSFSLEGDAACDGYSQVHSTYRVTEFLLAWSHSGLLAVLPHNFAFLYFCLFFVSFNMAYSSVCVLKILAPLPVESFCAAPLSARARSRGIPGFTPCFSLFWTVSNDFAPKGSFLWGFPQDYQHYCYKIINVEEALYLISMKCLKCAFKNKLLSWFNVSFRGCLRMEEWWRHMQGRSYTLQFLTGPI